ncbi:uncharacterized protein LOC124140731 [Haliotis rufescens]|uniref:uncharacterized protein LOC124140731 n=1 Tax=Haliotis rufescens TaxID=6454 RepID=UPI00201F0C9F|nr:uncharacterized protein LOC124140731 [Haliotis rufescens]
MRVFLLVCVMYLQWRCTQSAFLCSASQCVPEATCEGGVCVCPVNLPDGDGRFYCYQKADRLVGIEYGDPLVHTLIPSENYRFPTPCGHMILKGNIPGDCYISAYANGPDLDTISSISRTFINGIEIIMKKHSNETRMIVNTGVEFRKNDLPVTYSVTDGMVNIDITECSTVIKYYSPNPYVVIDIPKSGNLYQGSMLPTDDPEMTLKQQAERYNLTVKQDTLVMALKNINSISRECQTLHDQFNSYCLDVADEDIATLICGQYVFTDDGEQCLSHHKNARQLLSSMTECFLDVCLYKKTPCDVISKHFFTCEEPLSAELASFNCNW